MTKNLWRYDKCVKKAASQSQMSMYIVTTVLVSILVFFLIFTYARSIYGETPESLTNLSLLVITVAPLSVLGYSYHRNTLPKFTMRAYNFYLDDEGQLWMFDYNSQPFEDYYDAMTGGKKGNKFSGTHKERTVEFCLNNDAVREIIKNPPYNKAAHHITKLVDIKQQGKFLKISFICHSDINKSDYPGGVALPLDMIDLPELRATFETLETQEGALTKPKAHDAPGIMYIESVRGDEDGAVVLYGIMEEGTISRGDRVIYADEFHEPISKCKMAHVYRDGREIVWAVPIEEAGESYEVHIKGGKAEDYVAGNFFLSIK